MWSQFAVFFSLLAVSISAHSENFILNEQELIKLINESPETDRIKARLLGSEVNYRRNDDPYFFSLNGSANVQSSREQALTPFPPVRRASNYELTINRPLPYGVDLSVGYNAQKSTSFIADAATNRLVGRVSFDLFRNFLGRTTKSLLDDAKLGFEAAKIQNKIDKKTLLFQTRRLFWNYVAAKESKDFAEKLLKSSREQLKLVKRKLRSDVADAGDVARFSSQVSEQQSQSLQFEGNMRQLEAQIGELFPSLIGKKIVLGPYTKKDTMKQFFQCLSVVSSKPSVPLEFTLIDELIELRKKQLEKRQRANSAYADIDVRLQAEVGLVGTGIGSSAASSNLSNDQNDFNSVGLTVSLPLDGKRKSTEKSQIALEKAQTDAEIRRAKSQMAAFHSVVVENIKLVTGIIESRTENDKFLEKALKDSRKKFQQARITSQQLLQEESTYLANAIQLISTERDILLFMFDYLALFTETPCALNSEVSS